MTIVHVSYPRDIKRYNLDGAHVKTLVVNFRRVGGSGYSVLNMLNNLGSVETLAIIDARGHTLPISALNRLNASCIEISKTTLIPDEVLEKHTIIIGNTVRIQQRGDEFTPLQVRAQKFTDIEYPLINGRHFPKNIKVDWRMCVFASGLSINRDTRNGVVIENLEEAHHIHFENAVRLAKNCPNLKRMTSTVWYSAGKRIIEGTEIDFRKLRSILDSDRTPKVGDLFP